MWLLLYKTLIANCDSFATKHESKKVQTVLLTVRWMIEENQTNLYPLTIHLFKYLDSKSSLHRLLINFINKKTIFKTCIVHSIQSLVHSSQHKQTKRLRFYLIRRNSSDADGVSGRGHDRWGRRHLRTTGCSRGQTFLTKWLLLQWVGTSFRLSVSRIIWPLWDREKLITHADW
jgi:hypothetical protein